MTDEWYIDADGRVEGPVSAAELQTRAAVGSLRPTDSVSADRTTWVAAGSMPGLAFPAQPQLPLVETIATGFVGPSPVAFSPPDFSPLDSVPGYIVQGTLGTGACGVVFRAVQVKLDRVVALKTVRLVENAPPEVVARFEQEAVSLARLQHPNIVAVYDCGHSHGRAYFAMELLDGEDLGARLDRAGPLTERAAWLVARQTAAALAHAANLGVIHRDVKPANLFLVPPPTGFPLPPDVPMVKVTDFGLALTRRAASDGDPRQTTAGAVVGTPVYMAPEQFAGSDVDPRADIYSLGATVHHVLTGRVPFDGRTIWDVLRQKNAAPPALGVPSSPETAALVAAMMAANAADRPADYATLIARIDALPCMTGAFSSAGLPAVGASMAHAPAAVPVRRRKRWVYAVVAVAMLGVAISIAVLAGALSKPGGNPAAKPRPPRPTYTAGQPMLLYVSGSLAGWVATGGAWQIERDEEQSQVLVGRGSARRPFQPPPHFRVILGIDPHQTNAVEVVIATTADPPEIATQWLVRLDRAGSAAFGKRVGAGAFERVGNTIPLPTTKELVDEARRPYLEVKYERAGGELWAWCRGQLLGSTPANGLRMTELRVNAIGGTVRIDYAALEMLVEK